jgi:hypothetical protein|tara:strand:- start:114 stop:260 length:147 start_codon:yes stop_codon:yes gene_type:complete
MIIKALILSTMLNSDPIFIAMPPTHKIEARKRGGKGHRGRRRGGSGLR